MKIAVAKGDGIGSALMDAVLHLFNAGGLMGTEESQGIHRGIGLFIESWGQPESKPRVVVADGCGWSVDERHELA